MLKKQPIMLHYAPRFSSKLPFEPLKPPTGMVKHQTLLPHSLGFSGYVI